MREQQAGSAYRTISQPKYPSGDILHDCEFQCSQNASCALFQVRLSATNDNQCTLYDQSLSTDTDLFIDNFLLPGADQFVMRKVCLNVPRCESSLWYFEMVPGYSISSAHEGVNQAQTTESMASCQALCVNEQAFRCRAAVYDRQTKNCLLSHYDRRSLPPRTEGSALGGGEFRKSSASEVYMENQCAKKVTKGCEYQSISGSAMSYTLAVQSTVANEDECKEKCEAMSTFECRALVFDKTQGLCRMSSEDTYSIEALPPSVSNLPSQVYLQKLDCTQVVIECATELMRVLVEMNHEFSGKLFAVDAKDSCIFDIGGLFDFDLNLSLKDPARCAIHEEKPNIYSTTFMIQYYDTVLTGKDRMFKFACKYDLASQHVENSIQLSDAGGTPRFVTGSGRSGNLPKAEMRIVNGIGESVSTAEIGQTLFAEVVLENDGISVNESDRYGIFVTGCEALIGNQNVALVDSAGLVNFFSRDLARQVRTDLDLHFRCPLDTNVFEGFAPVADSNNRRLRAAFRGFRFETKSRVNLNCDVNLCFEFCEPALCTDRNGRRIQSYGKRRRRNVFVSTERVSRELLVTERNALSLKPAVDDGQMGPATSTAVRVTPLAATIVGSLFVLCALVLLGVATSAVLMIIGQHLVEQELRRVETSERTTNGSTPLTADVSLIV